jgi:hypothetical protein
MPSSLVVEQGLFWAPPHELSVCCAAFWVFYSGWFSSQICDEPVSSETNKQKGGRPFILRVTGQARSVTTGFLPHGLFDYSQESGPLGFLAQRLSDKGNGYNLSGTYTSVSVADLN